MKTITSFALVSALALTSVAAHAAPTYKMSYPMAPHSRPFGMVKPDAVWTPYGYEVYGDEVLFELVRSPDGKKEATTVAEERDVVLVGEEGNAGASTEGGKAGAGADGKKNGSGKNGEKAAPVSEGGKAGVVEEEEGDPIEGFNRVIFEINDIFAGLFFTPIAKMYRGAVPEELRTRIHYVLRNLDEPVNFGNSLLQGDFEEAGTALGRFAVNSTLGVGGIFDVSTDFGMPYQSRDFGMTLASWGIGEGPYIMIPLLGPYMLRGIPGEAGDIAMDPLTWALPSSVRAIHYVRGGIQLIDDYQEVQPGLDDIRKNSIDHYASLRSWYRERRRSQVREGLGIQEEEVDSPVPFDEPSSGPAPESKEPEAPAVSETTSGKGVS